METIIKIHPDELNSSLLTRIRQFIGSKENVDVTISLKEYDPAYVEELSQSLQEAENGEVLSFTMEEFAAYIPKPNQ
jgi:hypothetical protein